MLHILFIALKVIGYILLAILCIILLIVAIVLISPFRYQLAGEGNVKEKRGSGEAHLSWLMRLIKVDVRFLDMKLAWRVKVAWLTLIQDGYEEEIKKEAKKDSKKENKKKKKQDIQNRTDKQEDVKTDESRYDRNETEDFSLSGKSRDEQPETVKEPDAGHERSDREASKEVNDQRDGNSIEIKDSGELSGENRDEQSGTDQKSDSGYDLTEREDSSERRTDEQTSSEGRADEQTSSEGRADGQTSSEGRADGQTSSEGRADGEDHSFSKTEEEDSEIDEKEKESTSEKVQKKSFNFEEFKETILEINKKIKIPFQKIESFQNNLEVKLDKAEKKYNEFIDYKDDIVAFIENEKHKKAFFKVIHAILYIIKKYLPRKGDIHLHFGLGDPYRTGLAFAFLSVIDPLTGGNIYASPEADEWMLDGSLSIKGHIRLVHLPLAVLSLAISPNIWRTVKDAKNLKILKK